jgi:hypothetical protein
MPIFLCTSVLKTSCIMINDSFTQSTILQSVITRAKCKIKGDEEVRKLGGSFSSHNISWHCRSKNLAQILDKASDKSSASKAIVGGLPNPPNLSPRRIGCTACRGGLSALIQLGLALSFGGIEGAKRGPGRLSDSR